ncbi:hypothetical protein BHM03_00011297 [Ensete ventricosum]|nr:hypothetical protein BHM03_00011297 [Ensete ventricosum]
MRTVQGNRPFHDVSSIDHVGCKLLWSSWMLCIGRRKRGEQTAGKEFPASTAMETAGKESRGFVCISRALWGQTLTEQGRPSEPALPPPSTPPRGGCMSHTCEARGRRSRSSTWSVVVSMKSSTDVDAYESAVDAGSHSANIASDGAATRGGEVLEGRQRPKRKQHVALAVLSIASCTLPAVRCLKSVCWEEREI